MFFFSLIQLDFTFTTQRLLCRLRVILVSFRPLINQSIKKSFLWLTFQEKLDIENNFVGISRAATISWLPTQRDYNYTRQ